MTKEDITRAEALLDDYIKKNPDGYKLSFDRKTKLSEDTFAAIYSNYKDYLGRCSEDEKLNITFKDYLMGTIEGLYELDSADSKIPGLDWLCLEDIAADDVEWDMMYGLSLDEQNLVKEYLEHISEEDGWDHSLLYALEERGFTGYTYDVEDLVDDYKVNIMLGTPVERNLDMGSIVEAYIDVINSKNPEKYAENVISDGAFDNALSYLICQQGHSMAEIADKVGGYLKDTPQYRNSSSFVKSTVKEICEFPAYSMTELTVLATVGGSDLEAVDRIAKGEGCIEFSDNAMIGLYNEWQGTGSLLEIELDKPFVCPASMVRNMQVEDAGRSNAVSGYTVNDVYGLVGSCWKGSVKASDSDPVKMMMGYREIMGREMSDIPRSVMHSSYTFHLPDCSKDLQVYGVTALSKSEAMQMDQADLKADCEWGLMTAGGEYVDCVYPSGKVSPSGIGIINPATEAAKKFAVRPALIINAEAEELEKGEEFYYKDLIYKVTPAERGGKNIAIAKDILRDEKGQPITVPFRDCVYIGDGTYAERCPNEHITEQVLFSSDITNWERSTLKKYIEKDFTNKYGIVTVDRMPVKLVDKASLIKKIEKELGGTVTEWRMSNGNHGWRCDFSNGYSADITDTGYGKEHGLLETAVMLNGKLCYDTPITKDSTDGVLPFQTLDAAFASAKKVASLNGPGLDQRNKNNMAHNITDEEVEL